MAKDPRAVDDDNHDEQGASPKELLFAACRTNNSDLLNEVLSLPSFHHPSSSDSNPAAADTTAPSKPTDDSSSTSIKPPQETNPDTNAKDKDTEKAEKDKAGEDDKEGGEEGEETPLSKFLNHSRDSLGRMALHVAAKYGNPDILDTLLDQEGLEVDPESLMEGDTPLHVAAQYTSEDPDVGGYMIHLLVDAGADPRLKNKGQQKPLDLVDPGCQEVRAYLQEAEAEMEREAAREAAQRAFEIDLARQAKQQQHYGGGGGDVIDDLDEAGSGPASDSE